MNTVLIGEVLAVTMFAVTIGAVLVGYAAGVEVTRIGSDGIEQGEDQAPILSVIAVVALMGTMAWGMWRARYWAVLGFQALLALLMLSAGVGLVQVTTLLQAIGTVLVLGGSATLFYFMVKALARIQMPQRLPPT